MRINGTLQEQWNRNRIKYQKITPPKKPVNSSRLKKIILPISNGGGRVYEAGNAKLNFSFCPIATDYTNMIPQIKKEVYYNFNHIYKRRPNINCCSYCNDVTGTNIRLDNIAPTSARSSNDIGPSNDIAITDYTWGNN